MNMSTATNTYNESAGSSWSCWVDESAHVLSFHEIKGYQWQLFRSHTAFWLYIRAKTMEGYLIM